MSLGSTAKSPAVLDHLESVQWQLEELTRMLESNANCMDVLKQIRAVQSSLESASRVTLHRHLETCFSNAILHGRGGPVMDELMDAMQSTPVLPDSPLERHAPTIGRRPPSITSRHLSATTLTLPGIASRTCKVAIERVISPIAGVSAAEVDVLAKSVTIYHDYRAPRRRLIDAIEEQGYHVSDAAFAAGREDTGSGDSRWPRGGDGNRGGEPGGLYPAPAGPGFVDGDGI